MRVGRRWQPQIMAWSTPGIAFLVFALDGYAFSDAIGAFLVSNLVILLIGYLTWFQKVMALIPISVAAALNAGIFAPLCFAGYCWVENRAANCCLYGADVFCCAVFLAALGGGGGFVGGGVVCVGMGKANMDGFVFAMATPIFTAPTFDLNAMFDIAIPLTVLALTGQYLPGLAVLKSYGYQPDNDRIVKQCGFVSMLFAPFGCHNINPSSMIAGIVAGPEAHEDLGKRYWASIVAGGVYIVFGTLATSFVLLFLSLPAEAIMALAGISLLAAIAHALNTAMREEVDDIVTPTAVFIVAISDVEILSIGSTFWAIVIGLVISIFQRYSRASV